MPLVIKTTEERYAELESIVRECHPYDLPEIIAFPVTHGLENYLGWVMDECKPDPDSRPAP